MSKEGVEFDRSYNQVCRCGTCEKNRLTYLVTDKTARVSNAVIRPYESYCECNVC